MRAPAGPRRVGERGARRAAGSGASPQLDGGSPRRSRPEYREAIRLEPSWAEAHRLLGSALRSKGDLDGAAAAYREAIRLEPERAVSHLGLGHTLARQAHFSEARDAYRRAHELGSAQPRWTFPSADYLADAERAAAFESRVPAILAGAVPRDAEERLGFACVLMLVEHRAEAAALYETIVDALPGDVASWHRYRAAGCASMASAGEPSWRRKALAWLRVDLAARRARLVKEPSALALWATADDLAPVRDDLDSMPADEREAWQSFWAEVKEVRQLARDEG